MSDLKFTWKTPMLLQILSASCWARESQDGGRSKDGNRGLETRRESSLCSLLHKKVKEL